MSKPNILRKIKRTYNEMSTPLSLMQSCGEIKEKSPRKQKLEIVKCRENDHGIVIIDTFSITDNEEREHLDHYEYPQLQHKQHQNEQQRFNDLESIPSLFELYNLNTIHDYNNNEPTVSDRNVSRSVSLSPPYILQENDNYDNDNYLTSTPFMTMWSSSTIPSLTDIGISELICHEKFDDIISQITLSPNDSSTTNFFEFNNI